MPRGTWDTEVNNLAKSALDQLGYRTPLSTPSHLPLLSQCTESGFCDDCLRCLWSLLDLCMQFRALKS